MSTDQPHGFSTMKASFTEQPSQRAESMQPLDPLFLSKGKSQPGGRAAAMCPAEDLYTGSSQFEKASDDMQHHHSRHAIKPRQNRQRYVTASPDGSGHASEETKSARLDPGWSKLASLDFSSPSSSHRTLIDLSSAKIFRVSPHLHLLSTAEKAQECSMCTAFSQSALLPIENMKLQRCPVHALSQQ